MKKQEKNALYAGSFDPITVGHQFLIKEGSELFDHLTIVLSTNKNKISFFSIEERKKQILFFIKDFDNVTLEVVEDEYVVDIAERTNSKFLLRGLRDTVDYGYEQKIESINNQLNPNVKTIYISSPDNLKTISSSMVKSLIGYKGWQNAIKNMVNELVLSDIVRKEMISYISKEWKRLAGDSEVSCKYLKIIIDSYSQSHRHYHNLNHVMELLQESEQLFTTTDSWNLENKSIILYSIFFHDVIYDPMKKDNESESNKLFLKFAKEHKISDIITECVSESILATANHSKVIDSEIVSYFLDLDLSILGSSSDRFNEYEKQIKNEFYFVPEDIFIHERGKIMKSLLNPYKTEWGRKRYLKQSQTNLKKYQ